MPIAEQDPCLPVVQSIDACMRDNNFESDKCTKLIEEMRKCCKKWKEESLVCKGAEMVKRFLSLFEDK